MVWVCKWYLCKYVIWVCNTDLKVADTQWTLYLRHAFAFFNKGYIYVQYAGREYVCMKKVQIEITVNPIVVHVKSFGWSSPTRCFSNPCCDAVSTCEKDVSAHWCEASSWRDDIFSHREHVCACQCDISAHGDNVHTCMNDVCLLQLRLLLGYWTTHSVHCMNPKRKTALPTSHLS